MKGRRPRPSRHLHGQDTGRSRERASTIRCTMGRSLPADQYAVARELGAPDRVLQLRTGHSQGDLHHQCHRVDPVSASEGDAPSGSVSDHRFRSQGPLPCADESERAVDHADSRLARRPVPSVHRFPRTRHPMIARIARRSLVPCFRLSAAPHGSRHGAPEFQAQSSSGHLHSFPEILGLPLRPSPKSLSQILHPQPSPARSSSPSSLIRYFPRSFLNNAFTFSRGCRVRPLNSPPEAIHAPPSIVTHSPLM